MLRASMKRLTCLAALLLFHAVGIHSACVHVDNQQELIEYSCEGGSIEDLKKIPGNAEKIRISNMPVGKVTESLFSRFGGNLVVLTCSHCLITDIEDRAFRRLENLQQLSLDNNHLKEVRGAWFEGLVYLTYLDLNYNNIERIDGDVFQNAPEIVDLRVSGNRLICLDVESMSRLKDLKRIFLNENPSFACPNAVKKFLMDRRIDFEADPHWNSMTQDQVQASAPLPAVPPAPIEHEYRERYATTTPAAYYTRPPWTPSQPSATQPPNPEPTTIPPTMPPRRPYVPEMIQPHVPEQDFTFQGPYYAPKVNQQQLDEYRNSMTQQAQNASDIPMNRTSVDMANDTSSTVSPTEFGTTTECPNSGVAISRNSMLIGFALLMLSTYKWTVNDAEIL